MENIQKKVSPLYWTCTDFLFFVIIPWATLGNNTLHSIYTVLIKVGIWEDLYKLYVNIVPFYTKNLSS